MSRRLNQTVAYLLTMVMLCMAVLSNGPMGLWHAQAAGQSLKFDFGTESSDVMSGFLQVHNNLLYTAERGYGLDAATNARSRSTGDALTKDFLIPGATNPYSLLVDVPNGSYTVTVYSGDMIGTGTTKTTVTIEGELKGTISAKASVGTGTYTTSVTDGQMTITFGNHGYVNGVIIEPVAPAAPTDLTVSQISLTAPPSVSLVWSSVYGAVYYDLYRNTVGEATYSVIGRTTASQYTDKSVTIGSSYEYRIASVSAYGVSSAISAPVTASLVKTAEPPAAPVLTIQSVTADSVAVGWTASSGANGYKLYRADSSEGPYSELTDTTALTYTDRTADTSKAHYYKVTAYNGDGTSGDSNVAASTVYAPAQPLPEGSTYSFDFGPGLTADGYVQVNAGTAYTSTLKYGFADPSLVTGADRGTSDALKSDFVIPSGATFQVDLPNGDYSVTMISGDETTASQTGVTVESIQKVAATDAAAGSYTTSTFNIALVDGQLNFAFSGTAPRLNSLVITKLAERTKGDIPTVYIAGDSTVQTYTDYWRPQAGWGQMIPKYFTEDVKFDNQAIGGRSSKSFLVQGRLDNILLSIKPGDYFFIQFGHNDATVSVPERYATPEQYAGYLKTYVNGARQRGATPVLITPMGRRDYNETTGKFNVSFPEYVAAMKGVAQELNVDLVDLSSLSVAYYDSIGVEMSKSVFLYVEPGIYEAFPSGSSDNTHFQEYGAIQIARLLSGGVKELGLPISQYVKSVELPAAAPAKPTGLTASSVSNAGATLSWNAADNADIYKVYRKLASDTEYKVVGTATTTTLTIGGMAAGSTYSIYVTAYNGHGESEPSEPITISTKYPKYKYDFGTVTSPVAEGYTQVTTATLYTPELGYGIKDSTGMITRDRGSSGTDLTRDWLGYFNVGWEFMVDLPNGNYSVTAYIGDLSGTAITTVTMEGTSYGSVTGKNSVTEKVFNNVLVKDGQLNIKFGGTTGICNGIEITPILQAPTGLTVSGLDLEQPSVKLSWTAADNASKYRVYRTASGASVSELLGETTETFYTDLTADVGMQYSYAVTTVDYSSLESVPSLPVSVSTIDTTKPVPAAPTGLTLGAVHKNDLTFTWDSVSGVVSYNIYRSKKADGDFVLIGKSKTASYTDTTVLTTIAYYYKVAAVNAGGTSSLSSVLETPVSTTLVRQMEYLDRAPVAMKTDGGVFVSWKLLALDPAGIAFNLYRDGVLVNSQPITDSTNYLDPAGTTASKYKVYSITNGVQKAATDSFSVWDKNYLSVPLQKPADATTPDGSTYTYNAGDASVGDLDGDGTYEIVMLWSPSNAKDNSQSGYTGIVYMDAYKLDGTRLWRITLGPNIRAGAHYSPFLVYDFDGDGKAEIAFKTADGTVDGTGHVIGDATADYRNSSGYILDGPEYLTMFNGLTGAAIDTVDYDPPRGDVSLWGDSYGNRVDRFLGAVAYLDGEHPSLVMTRGYYTRTVLVAYDFKNGKLTKRWRFDTNDDGKGEYVAQGNHNLSVGDVDNDGKDEIHYGALGIDDDGSLLYATMLGHGDAIHFGDLNPAHPGLEVFAVHEHTDSDYGYEMHDANTGEILWGVKTGIDTGRGMSADIDPNYPGEEAWAATITNAQHIPLSGLHSSTGQVITDTIPTSTNFGIWWDGDLLRELLDDNRVDKWDYTNHTTVNLLTATGAASNNSTKANPMLQADIFGDWREEVIWRSTDSSELRIYSTTDLTTHRIRTLMQDPNYRLAVAWQNVGYNQPPHPGFYLGVGMTEPAAPSIYLVNAPAEPAVNTTAVLTGPEHAAKGMTFATTYSLAQVNPDGTASVTNAVYAQDITVTYDPAVVTFVDAVSVRNGVSVLSAADDGNGKVRILLASMGQGSAITADGNVLTINWLANQSAGSTSAVLSISKAILSNGSGELREAEGSSLTVPLLAYVDKAGLNAAIAAAQTRYDNAVEGLEAGQYYPGSKARFLSAITNAKTVASNEQAAQSEVQAAAEALALAAKAFIAASGDVAGQNGTVNIGDIAVLAANYGKTAASSDWSSIAYMDINASGSIDLADLVIVAKKIV